MDESQLSGNDEKVFPTVVLRGYLTRLAEDTVNQPHRVTDAEKSNLIRIRVQHCQTKEIRYAGRHWWCLWLGMQATPMPQILDDLFPCYEHIWTATGALCKDQHPNSTPCGRLRDCNMCERVLDMLARPGIS